VLEINAMTIRVLLLFSLSIAGCQTSGPPENPPSRSRYTGVPVTGSVVKGPGFVGVIFPASSELAPILDPPATSYWTPSESDVSAAEERLVPFLKNSNDPRIPEIVKNLATYKRQYRGVMSNGQKQIVIHFFCDAYQEDWKVEVAVADGGSCFFSIRFSTETQVFSDLEINGVA
jgi:hypothetical protein